MPKKLLSVFDIISTWGVSAEFVRAHISYVGHGARREPPLPAVKLDSEFYFDHDEVRSFFSKWEKQKRRNQRRRAAA